MTLTLKQFHEECRKLTEQGKEIYIEGLGDGRWRLVIEYIEITNKGGDNGTKTNV